MVFKDIKVTKKKALSFYIGDDLERINGLAYDLGINPQVVKNWKNNVPRWWAIVIVNLVHPDKFEAKK